MENHPHVLVLDADGCFFGRNYYKLFIEVLNRHWDFVNNFGEYPSTLDHHQDAVKKIIATIIAELDTIQLPQGSDFLGMIKHPAFNKEVEKIYTQLTASEDQSKQISIWQILAPILTQCIKHMNTLSPTLYKSICLQANKQFIQEFIAKYNQDDIQHIILVLGTNRQSYHADKLGCDINGTGPFVLSLSHLKEAFQFFLPDKKIVISQFTLSDIYGDLERGESFKKILASYQNNSNTNNHAESVFDHSKVTLLYAIIHDVICNVFPELGISHPKLTTVDFCDDLLPLIQQLGGVCLLNPEIMPKNVMLNLHNYCGEGQTNLITSIKGEGEVDRNFKENVKLMAKMCSYNQNSFARSINVAENFELNLQLFLQKRTISLENSNNNPTRLPVENTASTTLCHARSKAKYMHRRSCFIRPPMTQPNLNENITANLKSNKLNKHSIFKTSHDKNMDAHSTEKHSITRTSRNCLKFGVNS